MVTLAAYFRYKETGECENRNVKVGEDESFFGYVGSKKDNNSVVKWSEMLQAFARVKIAVARSKQ